jgi:hypothetical protein
MAPPTLTVTDPAARITTVPPPGPATAGDVVPPPTPPPAAPGFTSRLASNLVNPVPPVTLLGPELLFAGEPTPAPAFGFDFAMICPEIVTLPVARMIVPLGTVSAPVTVKLVN